MPETPEEESKMIATLESQLRFANAVQSVDTNDVPPLAAIRDETDDAKQEGTVTLDALRENLDRETQVGMSRRIVRKKAKTAADGNTEAWDLLKLAPSTLGRFIAVPKTSGGGS